MESKIDEKDRKILDVLQEHADYATRQVAKKTGLPITTVHNRIKKLKKEKIIKRFTVDVDYHKIQEGFRAYVLVSVDLSLLKQKKKITVQRSKRDTKLSLCGTGRHRFWRN